MAEPDRDRLNGIGEVVKLIDVLADAGAVARKAVTLFAEDGRRWRSGDRVGNELHAESAPLIRKLRS